MEHLRVQIRRARHPRQPAWLTVACQKLGHVHVLQVQDREERRVLEALISDLERRPHCLQRLEQKSSCQRTLWLDRRQWSHRGLDDPRWTKRMTQTPMTILLGRWQYQEQTACL